MPRTVQRGCFDLLHYPPPYVSSCGKYKSFAVYRLQRSPRHWTGRVGRTNNARELDRLHVLFWVVDRLISKPPLGSKDDSLRNAHGRFTVKSSGSIGISQMPRRLHLGVRPPMAINHRATTSFSSRLVNQRGQSRAWSSVQLPSLIPTPDVRFSDTSPCPSGPTPSMPS